MYINSIDFNNNNKIKADKNFENNASVPLRNDESVLSKTASTALRNVSFRQKNYTFLENVKIPYLDVNAKLFVLKNGQKLLVIKKDGPTVVKTHFKVGSMNENDNIRGISHYIEHNLFNGSKNYKAGEFVDNVIKMGGKYNASTGFNVTDYFVVNPLSSREELAKTINMHADMIARPNFSPEMLAKEKGPVISEIQMIGDNPQNKTLNALLKNLFQIKSNAQDLVGGSIENIQNLNRDTVLNYYNTYYTPDNAISVVISSEDEEKVAAAMSEEFKDFAKTTTSPKYNEELTPITTSVRQDLTSTNTQSTIINLGFSAPAQKDEKIALTLLLQVLAMYKNSRLQKAMDKYGTDISASIENLGTKPTDPQAVIFSTSTSKGNQEDILKDMYKEIHNVNINGISQEELNIAKEKLKNFINQTGESNMGITALLASTMLDDGNLDSLKNLDKILEKITPQDIQNISKKYLDLNKVSIALTHPAKKKSDVSFAGKIQSSQNINFYRLPNNIELTTNNTSDAKISAMKFELKCPELQEEKPGVSAMLKGMLTKGTSLMSEEEFTNIDDVNSIEKNISGSYNSITFNFKSPSDKVKTVLEQFKRNIYAPVLTQENFDKVKQELKNSYLSSPMVALDKGIEILYGDHPLGTSAAKAYKNLDNLTLDDVIEYYNKIAHNSEFSLSTTMDFDRNKEALGTIYSELAKIQQQYRVGTPGQNPSIKELESTKIAVETVNRSQADIVQLFRIEETGNVKDKVSIALLNEVLGGNSNSRLFNDLREKQKLAYRVNSFYESSDNEGILALNIMTTTDNTETPQYDNVKKSLEGFKNHINQLITTTVSQEELDAAKRQLKSRLAFLKESTQGKNQIVSISMNSPYKKEYLDEMIKSIDSATAEDIQKIARHYLTKPSAISIVASKDTIDNNADYLKSIVENK